MSPTRPTFRRPSRRAPARRRSRSRRALPRLLAVAAVALLAGGCFWPAPGQGPDRQAHNERETAITAATVGRLRSVWVARADDGPAGDPVTSAGVVHVNDTHRVYGFAAATGQRLWYADAGSANTMGQPLVTGDRVVANMTIDGPQPYGAHAEFDADTGTLRVGAELGRLTAVRGNDHLTFHDTYSGVSGGVWAYGLSVDDVVTGAVRCCPGPYWGAGYPAEVPPLTLAAGAVLHGGLGVNRDASGASTGNGVRAFVFRQTGICPGSVLYCPTWARPLPGTTTTAPVLTSDGRTTVVGTDTGQVAAVDVATGALRWTAELGSAVTGAPALAHGTLFVPTARGDLVALAAGGCGAATCTPLWSARTGSRITRQPAVAGGVVVTGSANGALRAYATSGCATSPCAPLWSASTGSEVTGAPAIDGGRLYVGTADGRLHAYGL